MEYTVGFEIDRADMDGPVEVEVRVADYGRTVEGHMMEILWVSDGYVLTPREEEFLFEQLAEGG